MLRTIDLRGRALSTPELLAAVPRATAARDEALTVAARIVHDVAARGEEALREQAAQFDNVQGHDIRVPQHHLDEALDGLDPAVRAALEEAIRRVREASAAQIPPVRVTELGTGARVEQRWRPAERVGVYVPGGKAVYPSSVVMNVVPAQVAGVTHVVLASPPQAEFAGRVHPVILAAARLLGVEEVYAMGGAGAIGAYAYGVPGLGLERVDVISGPGNNFVALAKRVVAGVVGTDSEAGATEILVVADASADADWVAADLVSQAEHDEQAAAVLVTDSAESRRCGRRACGRARRRDAARRPRRRRPGWPAIRDRARRRHHRSHRLQQRLRPGAPGAAPRRARARDPRVDAFVNAGAVFVGGHSPVSLGDYLAGSNHVLPTGGQARYAAGLSASTFLRPQQIIAYDRAALADVQEGIVALATAEALPAHGEAVVARFAQDGAR